ncbi:hypothetical protein POM88_047284 [Heracleum sosnowskyi]|uniref:Pentatricopeptide repeat-containing protein n=1 Tax=Heracleum sosnowskyi TaxID=360622 RepID=A0AAD8GU17_9APIA|nr:hypothetical protein POM88_047284 [Heracleum sosnowskyi]
MDYGYLYAARRVFDEMPNKNLSSWSTMITGYVKYDLPHRTIKVFQLFKEQGLAADVSIISAVCSACSKLGNLDVAMSAIHHYDGPYLYHNVHFIASYIQMYGGCGRIEEAWKVFVKASRGDLICFNSMIAAFASHGMGKEAIRLLDDMLIEKIKPEGATFLGVLRACNYDGLFEEGRKFFDQMVEDHEIQPTEEHYACMVEIFARLGDFREASRLGTASSSSVVWQAVLGAFSEDFKVAGANLIKREPSAAQLRDLSNVTKKKGIKGSSMIELGYNVHRFVDFGKWKAGDIPILKILDEEMGLSLDS